MVAFYEDVWFYIIFGAFFIGILVVWGLTLRKKYGKFLMPLMQFDWTVEYLRGYGASSQGTRFEFPARMPLKREGTDRARLELSQDDKTYKVIYQGDAIGRGMLKPAQTSFIPKNTNFDWGNKHIKVLLGQDLQRPLILVPEYNRDSFILPSYLSEAERVSIANAARHIVSVGQLKDASWLEKYGMNMLSLIIGLIITVLLINFWQGQGDLQLKIAETNQQTLTTCQVYAENYGVCKQLVNMTIGDTYLSSAIASSPQAAATATGGDLVPPWLK